MKKRFKGGKRPVEDAHHHRDDLFMRMLLRWAFYTIGIPNLISLCSRPGWAFSYPALSTKQTGRIIGRGGFCQRNVQCFRRRDPRAAVRLRTFDVAPDCLRSLARGSFLAQKQNVTVFLLASVGIIVGWYLHNWCQK